MVDAGKPRALLVRISEQGERLGSYAQQSLTGYLGNEEGVLASNTCSWRRSRTRSLWPTTSSPPRATGVRRIMPMLFEFSGSAASSKRAARDPPQVADLLGPERIMNRLRDAKQPPENNGLLTAWL